MSDHISEGIRWDAGIATGRLGLAESLLEWLDTRPIGKHSLGLQSLMDELREKLDATVKEESGFLYGSE